MYRFSLRATLIGTAVFFVFTLPSFAKSQVRIVRLSYISGSVEVARSSADFDKAIVNLPISQGMRLRTANDGRAEVELEDGSTIRLAPNTTIEFPDLSLLDSGEKESVIRVDHGTAYVDAAGSKHDQLTVQFGNNKIDLPHAAHVRVELDNQEASLAVFKGDLQINESSKVVTLKKNQTANFDLSAADGVEIAKDIDEEPFDAWDKQQDEYHLRYASSSYQSYSPYSYGTADLAYYGNFFNAPGYGLCWQPYFTGAGWDPFMDGAWAFSPGWGFGWVSAYPWGWVPYHYGSWLFVPGYGWAWQPGGMWMPWYSQPVLLNPPAGFAAPKAPVKGTKTLLVNRGPGSTMASNNKVVIRNNSAGLGVPRGEVRNLAKLSQRVETRGEVVQRAHPAPVAMMPAGIAGERTTGGARPSSIPSARTSSSPSRVSSPPPSHASAPPVHSAPPPPPAHR